MTFGAEVIGSNQHPEISVVVPAYNCAQFIARCLTSLSQQTFKNREIIVVDDGSTDDTAAIIQSWIRKDPTIRYIRKDNGGCASARSAGLDAATGDFIGFVDADDWVAPQMYEKLFLLAEQNRADVSQVGFCKVSSRGATEVHQDRLGNGDRMFSGITDRIRYRLLMGQPSIWRRLYRREFLRENEIDFPVMIRNFDDLTFQFEVLMTVDRIAVTDEPLYYYSLGLPDQSSEIRDDRHFVHFQLYDYLAQKYDLKKNPLIWKCFKRCQFNSHHWSRSLLKSEYLARHEALAAINLFEVGDTKESSRILRQLLAYTSERGLETLWALKCWWKYIRARNMAKRPLRYDDVQQ
jgi:glycosyltransferase involved in cell wall biosynthesis